MTLLGLEEIQLGDRVRKEMGDLKSLAESMERHGLLQPIVVKTDHTLVAGQRRIEAARLLGWSEIAVTVVDVEDLLSAEQDENTIRKDFTPTEAVAIGRLIEEQHRPAALERMREGWRNRTERGDPQHKRGEGSGAHPQVDDAAGAAVGMSRATYQRAKAVVAAAEKAPEQFGDLPARMDETGNITGAHREMQRRSGDKPAARHPVHNKAHHAKADDELRRLVTALEGLCIGAKDLKRATLDATTTKECAPSLRQSLSFLRSLYLRISNGKAAA